MVIELRGVQFWSEIILVISNHTYDFRPNCTPLSNYHYLVPIETGAASVGSGTQK